MGVTTVWTDPSTGGSIDLATGGTVTETIWDQILSNLKRLGGSAGLIQVTDAGMLLLNETANANMTVGATLHQGAATNEILDVKRTGVAHGMTSEAETDTYGHIKPFETVAGNAGGMLLSGYTGGTRAVGIRAGVGTADNTTAGTSLGIMHLSASVRVGAGPSTGGAAAADNLFAVDNNGTVQMILKGNGNLWLNGTVDAFDDFDDALAVRDLAQVLPGRDDRVRRYNRDDFAAMGVLTVSAADGSTFVSTKAHMALMGGAIGQLLDRIERMEARNGSLEARIAGLTRTSGEV